MHESDDAILERLRRSPVTARYFEADGSLVVVAGGSDLPPEGDPAGGLPPDDDGGSGATGSGTAWPTEADLAARIANEPDPELDDDGGDPPAPPAPPAAPATPPVPEGTEPPVVPEQDPNLGALAELPPKWQSEVKRLRNEAAENRVEAKRYTEAFDGWEDNDIAGFLEIAAGLSSNDQSDVETSGRRLLLAGKNILESLGIDVGDVAAPDPNRPMTRAEFQKEQERIARERDLEEHMRQLSREITDLGYEAGSMDHILLIQFAAQSDDGDVQKAHEAVEAYKKGIVDQAIAELQGKKQRHLRTQPAVGTAPPPTPDEPPKTMDEAVKRFMEDPAYGEVIS